MKGIEKAGVLTAALVFAACSISVGAQDAPSSASTDNVSVKNIQMVGARAWLNKSIDAKKAKQGDAVTAKLVDNVKIPDSMELPKNTILIGHIDQVQPSENKSDSSLQVTFDKAQLKNGQQLAIKATIMQISAPPSVMRNQESGAADATPAPSSPMPSSSGSAGGGGGMQSTQSSPRPTPTQSTAATAPDLSQLPGQQSVLGVQLQSDVHQSNSGVFTAKKRNVHLDEGTQLQMAIAVIPPNAQVQ
jgi:hypothetical protein